MKELTMRNGEVVDADSGEPVDGEDMPAGLLKVIEADDETIERVREIIRGQSEVPARYRDWTEDTDA